MSDWPIHITIPMPPKSVNTYVRHCVIQGKIRRFKHKEALAFEEAGSLCIGGQAMRADRYAVRIKVYLGKRQNSDVDNYAKQPLDLLEKWGVIHSDKAVTDLHITKEPDWDNPRTEIYVRAA